MSSSTSAQTWNGRSAVSTFVHGLHLLDLDRREDWPGLSVQSFGAKSNLQHRIRCVEWSLYRLFELYDARSTREKLRPFFPPATSLQSVNLRAALLRQLTELKKDGLLGANIVLRKTMLDECKGDKFEELLAAFSLLVLKKSTSRDGAPDPKHIQRDNLVPLVLSYRKAIQRDLEKRKELDLRARQQLRSINNSIDVYSVELDQLKRQRPPATPENAEQLRALLRENWIGEYAWVDTILHGTVPTSTANSEHTVTEESDDDNATKLLLELESKVKVHKDRLKQWQLYLKDMQSSPEFESPLDQEGERTPQRAPASRFSLLRKNQPQATLDPKPADGSPLKSRYAALSESLDRSMTFRAPSTNLYKRPAPIAVPVVTEIADQESTPRASRFDRTLRREASTSSDGSARDNTSYVSDALSLHSEGENANKAVSTHHGPSTPPYPHHGPADPGFGIGLGENQSLLERTRASLAQFETPKANTRRVRDSISAQPQKQENAPLTSLANSQSDRSSLLERTRQSMSMLANALDDNSSNRRRSGPRKSMHSRSKTINIPSHRPRLERAWSEESLASTATKESIDLEADYESVFKSRPRLAESPNLSPQRAGGDLWLEAQLEESMNKLTINSSPDETRL